MNKINKIMTNRSIIESIRVFRSINQICKAYCHKNSTSWPTKKIIFFFWINIYFKKLFLKFIILKNFNLKIFGLNLFVLKIKYYIKNFKSKTLVTKNFKVNWSIILKNYRFCRLEAWSIMFHLAIQWEPCQPFKQDEVFYLL